MGIKMITPMSTILDTLKKGKKSVKDEVVKVFTRAGEEAVRGARAPRGKQYTDRTSNLRSSTGYVLTVDGKPVIGGGYTPVKETGKPGAKAGKVHGNNLAKGADANSVSLFVTTGMSYAQYLDARAYDILDTAEADATAVLEEKLKRKK